MAAVVESMARTALECWNIRSEEGAVRDMVRTAGVTLGGVTVGVDDGSITALLMVKLGASWPSSLASSVPSMQCVVALHI